MPGARRSAGIGLGCLAGRAIKNQNSSFLGGVRLERKKGISGRVRVGLSSLSAAEPWQWVWNIGKTILS